MSEFTLIEASNGAKPKVVGVAYSGGKMSLPGWRHPVVVDLAGMEIPESVPLLTNHENKTDSRIGLISAAVRNNVLEITGEIVSDSKDAADIIAQGKAGADWQLSIGADVKECELVKGNREVNGQEVEGPFYHIKKSTLREVSVVAVGADAHTNMKVNAKFNLVNQEGEAMNNKSETKSVSAVSAPNANDAVPPEKKPEPEQKPGNPANKPGEPEKKPDNAEKKPGQAAAEATPPAIQASAGDVAATAREAAQNAVKAERERISAIQAICDGEFPEIEREAIAGGWTPEVVTKKVLETIRAERPAANVNISVKTAPEGGELRKTIEAAMCLRVGVSADQLEKSYGAKTVEAGMAEMDMPLKQLLIECMKLDGIPYSRGFDNETIRAAFSSVSLPGILSNVANKKLLQSYEAQPIIAMKLCSTGDLNDFKENDRFRLTDVGDLLPIAADGEIKVYAISEHIEYAGVHSGDATIQFPPQKLYVETMRRIKKVSQQIAKALKISGPFNIQFLAKDNDIKVIECNLRASRSFPFVSKVLKINFIDLATRIMLGLHVEKPAKNAFDLDYVGIKASQFSFSRLQGADPVLGVDMSSTGEVGCIGVDTSEAILKSMLAVGLRIPAKGVLLSTGGPKQKADMLEAARMLHAKGLPIYATGGTYRYLIDNGIPCVRVYWPSETDRQPQALELLHNKQVDLVVNIPKDLTPTELGNGHRIRRAAIDLNISLLTNARLASAFIRAFTTLSPDDIEIVPWDEY